MLWLIPAVFTWLQSFVPSRHDLGLEIVALRHQLVILKRRTKRARLQRSDRQFWILLRRFWRHWAKSLLIVQPETVLGWHRQGFRLYWRFRSRRRVTEGIQRFRLSGLENKLKFPMRRAHQVLPDTSPLAKFCSKLCVRRDAAKIVVQNRVMLK